MTINTILYYEDNDPWEEIIKEASDEKLRELLRIYLRFGADKEAEAVKQEIEARERAGKQN